MKQVIMKMFLFFRKKKDKMKMFLFFRKKQDMRMFFIFQNETRYNENVFIFQVSYIHAGGISARKSENIIILNLIYQAELEIIY